MNRTLAHDIVVPPNADAAPDSRRWVVFLHGIFGQGRNWLSLAKQLVDQRPDLGVVLVDLRQHGRSTGFPPPHNVDSVAADVAHLIRHLALDDHVIVGHSFGGKVALRHVADAPVGLSHAFIVDSTPDAVASKNQGAMMLALLRRLPRRFASRDEAVQAMASFGVSTAVGRWMATNLIQDESPAADPDKPYIWRFDLDDIDTMLADFYPAEFWHVVESSDPLAELHFIRASEGTLLSDTAAARIAAAANDRVHLHEVAGDHWLNVSNPGAIVSLIDSRVPSDAVGSR